LLKGTSLPIYDFASSQNNYGENTEKLSELNKAVLDLEIKLKQLLKLNKNDTLIKIKELCVDLKKLISEYTEQPSSNYEVAYSKPQKYNPAHIRPNRRKYEPNIKWTLNTGAPKRVSTLVKLHQSKINGQSGGEKKSRKLYPKKKIKKTN